MGCRFPGAPSPDAYWDLLSTGRDAVREIPPDRWNIDRYFSSDPDAPGKMYTRHGSFIEHPDLFDAQFFGISPREANALDPQQRLLLEVTWEALEDAFIPPASLEGSRTGVFVGLSTNDYLQYGCRYGTLESTDAYAGTGCSPSVACGRLSYTLGLAGPSCAVDTACSSSLVALHLAAMSLRRGDCDLALAGGVNLMLLPGPFIYFSKLRALSPDGRCKTFDASANGYGRGEGCGVVALKRLSDAVANNDRIAAVIRGSAVNHDGRSNGLTVPSGLAQEAVVREALADARLSAAEIGYVEAHGTGTPLGDPIELHALGNVHRGRPTPLLVGSAKTNFGHLEAAAGIAGVIKTAMILSHRQIPAHLHLSQPSPYIDWDNLPIETPVERTQFPATAGRPMAGVSSFGFGGTNAHVILEAAPDAQSVAREYERSAHVMCLSAKNEDALRELAQRTSQHLATDVAGSFADACHSANAGRSHFDHRLAVRAADARECRETLADFVESRPSDRLETARLKPRAEASVAFLFTGQGAQYHGMGRELYDTAPRFRDAIVQCEQILGDRLGIALTDLLWGEESARHHLLDRTEHTQPALFALEYALGQLWLEWGVQPRAAVGHSVGEYAAACLAGVFSLEDGLELISSRGRLMRELCGPGSMAALECDGDMALTAIEGYEDRVSIAAFNGPRNTVISGDDDAMERLLRRLSDEGVKARRLKVSHAFHSPMMEPMLEAFAAVASRVRFQPPRWPIISNVTGKSVDATELTDPQYWVRHVRQPVRFEAAVRALAERGVNAFLEIGPKPQLIGMARQIADVTGARWLPSLRPRSSDWNQMLDAVRGLYVAGVAIDWQAFDRPYGRGWTSLPSYPFQRRRFWMSFPVQEGPPPTGALLTAATVMEAEPAATEDPSAWVYGIRWKPHTASVAAAELRGDARTWLVLGDERGAGGRMRSALAAAGHECVLVTEGDALLRGDADSWSLRPERLDDYRALLKQLKPSTIAGVIHLWSIDAHITPQEPDNLEQAQRLGFQSALTLVQALLETGARTPPKVCIVTRGAQTVVDGDPTSGFVHAPMWGLARASAMEHPNLRLVLADLDGSAGVQDHDMEWLADLLTSEDRENFVARRTGHAYAARLVHRSDLASNGITELNDAGSWLITGGMGGIGLLVAGWLIERGVRRIALVGRSAPSAAAADAISQWTALGAQVRVMNGDVADRADCGRVVSAVRDTLGPITGVIHAAGLSQDTPLTQLDWERCRSVLRPKMLGAWNLHQATADDVLEHFICFSSASSVLGSFRQVNYSAANAFLDAFSGYRRALGRPSLTINWGPWVGVGMAARLQGEVRERWDALGVFGSLDPGVALETLGRIVAAPVAQVAVLSTDWEHFFKVFPLGLEPPFLQELAEQHKRLTPPTAAWLALLEVARNAHPEERRERFAAYLEKECAAVLGLAEGTAIDRDQGFFELGMDSLMSVEFRNRLQAAAGNSLIVPVTVIFDRPSINALVSYLEREALKVPVALATSAPMAERAAAGDTTAEGIAIIGVGCRFPGGANNPDAFWQNLRGGMDAIREVPAARWNVDDYFDADPDVPGKMNTRFGGFVDDIDQFDARFFGISPREASRMDPQHRLLLETVWHTLENACQPVSRLKGTPTGVFVGISANDYVRVLSRVGDDSQIDAYLGTGNALSMASGRIAHLLGLHGPTLSVDTACSSSLVAVHLACESLRKGECDTALAGGVNAILTPEVNVSLSKARMLAPDGHCKTFDASADGYGRGEGCGMVALKRLSDAQRDGDNVIAVIRGTAVNHDGRSSGLTVPNAAAQEALLEQCLAAARLSPAEIDYVEAHGTGTPLGDPIEVQTLGAVLGRNRDASHPLLIGTVKTNIGHLESAAGVAGLIKTALALHHGEIPASLHFKQPNPYIPWLHLPIEVVTERRAWPNSGRPHRAGVSSFGFSGTNAHAILEEAPPAARSQPSPLERTRHILCLSAKSPEALEILAEQTASLIESAPLDNLASICHTSNAGRAALSRRLAVVGADGTEMAARLRLTAANSTDVQGRRPRLAFLFSGQGSQYPGMGRELFDTHPGFRESILECERILGRRLTLPLTSLLWGEEAAENRLLEQTENTQPALFALQYALGRLWQEWGVQPRWALGHSVGEYAAACLAGVFSLEDGLELISARGRLMQERCAPGAMAALNCDATTAEAAIGDRKNTVSIAALNGPRKTAIAGAPEALADVLRTLELQGVKSQRLDVSHAFHSPLMEPMLDEFAAVARRVRFGRAHWTLVSSLTGRATDPDEMATADYWVRAVRQPVAFEAATRSLGELGANVFVEIGPKPVLLGMGSQILTGDGYQWLPSLRPRVGNWDQLLEALRALFLGGLDINWKGFDAPYSRIWTALPSYPFERQRFWADPAPAMAHVPAALAPPATREREAEPGHPLLGRPLRSPALPGTVYENRFSQAAPPFLNDHRIYSMIVVPGASHMSMVCSAAAEIDPEAGVEISDVSFQEVLVVPDDEVRLVQLVVKPQVAGSFDFEVHSSAESAETWLLHAAGHATITRSSDSSQGSPTAEPPEINRVIERCSEELNGRLWYQLMGRQGIQLGDQFQWIERVWRRDGEALGVLRSPQLGDAAAHYVIHPGLLDSCFQMMGATLSTKELEASAYIPISIERLHLRRRPDSMLYAHVKLRGRAQGADTKIADLVVFDQSKQVVAEIAGLRIHRAPRTALLRFAQRGLRDAVYSLNWIERPGTPLTPDLRGGRWLVFVHEGHLSDLLEQTFASDGASAVFVRPGRSYERVSSTHYRIDPAQPEHFDRVYGDALGGAYAVSGVLFLWSAHTLGPQAGANEIDAAQALGTLALMRVVQAVGRVHGGTPPRLFAATRQTQSIGSASDAVDLTHATLWGLGRVIATEHPQLRCVRIDLDDEASDEVNVRQLQRELAAGDVEDQVAFRHAKRYVLRLGRFTGGRLAVHAPVGGEAYQLVRSDRGLLAELAVKPAARQKPGPGELEILVDATGLNFRDVLNALALYPGDAGPLGGECAGTVVSIGEGVQGFDVGTRVMAMGAGTFSRFTVTDARMALAIPDDLLSADAASIPVAFVTAYFGLHHLADMRPGDAVLIHAGAGGVGLAAIHLARHVGAEIHATAGSEDKRQFLRSLGVRHVYNSRTLDFARQVAEATAGAGVNIVLNSLAGEFIEKSVEVTAKGGRFIELGKNNIWTPERMRTSRPDINYHTMALDDVIMHRPEFIGEMMSDVARLMAAGALKPLPLTPFAIADAVEAFRYMAQARHIGKVVVIHGSEAATEVDGPLVRADKTYLITGGLGALGLTLARRLCQMGARHLVLVGRRPPSDVALRTLSDLEALGAEVLIERIDVTNREELERLLARIRISAAPLGGIFHAAGALDDALIMRLDDTRFRTALNPKLLGAMNLHELTRDDDLQYFVLFSSAAATLGTPGQANYAAANAFLDALAHHRRQLGLPALTVNWGPWADAGMAAEAAAEIRRQWEAMGLSSISAKTGLATLEMLMREDVTQAVALSVSWDRLLRRFPTGMVPPLLADLVEDRARSAEPTAEWLTFVQQLEPALPVERRTMLIERFQQHVARVLGLDSAAKVDPRTPLNEQGLDSLMAVELANQLGATAGVSLPVTQLFDYPTIEKLAEYFIINVLKLEEAAVVAKPARPENVAVVADLLLDSISEMSDEEVEDRLKGMDATGGPH